MGSPTMKIWNLSITPSTDGGMDIGSSNTLRWNNLYLKGSAFFGTVSADNIYVAGTGYLSAINATNGAITNLTANVIDTNTINSISDYLTVNTKTGMQIGDSANYCEIDSSGHLQLNGAATVWDDLQINISSVRVPASNAPSWTAYQSSQVLAFDKAQTNIIYFASQFPHSYKVDSDIEFHMHLAYADANTGSTTWQFGYSWASMTATFPVATVVSTTIIAPAIAHYHQYAMITMSI